jgi:DNA-directed RNA polymerase specialized sigma24 family protein
MVWRYLRLLGADPHEADDLMQDTFVRLAEVLARGEPLQAPAAFLRGIGRNLLIGIRRRARTRDRRLNGPTPWTGSPASRKHSRMAVSKPCAVALPG